MKPTPTHHPARRPLRRATAAAVAALALTGLVEASGATAAEERAANAVDTPRVLRLPHVTSVHDALAAAAAEHVTPLELRFSGNGLVGGLVPSPEATIEEDTALAEDLFKRTFDRPPVVSSVVLPASTSDAVARSVQTRLAAAATPKITSGPVDAKRSPLPARLAASADAPRVLQAQDIDEHFPSQWFGHTYRTETSDGAARRGYRYDITYDSVIGHDPSTFPNDWGLELGVASYNPDLRVPGPLQRPLCPGADGNPNRSFWSSTWARGGAWATDVPDDADPYPDSNIDSDRCHVNSVDFGIGNPDQLAQDEMYTLVAELRTGTKDSSPAAASLQMQSDDCNNLGLDPNTNCMGLNTQRSAPEGFDQSQTLVNRDRNWAIPGCAWMVDGAEEPFLYKPGEPLCPEEDDSISDGD